MKTKIANLKRLDILGNGDCLSDREILTAMLKQWRQKLGYCSIFAAVPALLAAHISEARSDEAKKPEASVAGRTARHLDRLNNSSSNPALLKRQSEFRLAHQKGSFDMLAALGGTDDCPGRTIPAETYTTAAPYIDSGDTTGANDTVTSLPYYYTYDAHGPDHVYSFTLTGRSSNPRIEVSTTSGTYRPLIYVLRGGPAGACPAGTGNFPHNILVMNDSRWTPGSSTAILNNNQMSFLPLNVPLYLFVDSAGNDASGSGPYTILIQDVTIEPSQSTKPGVFRPLSGEFFLKNSNSSGFADTSLIFGNPGDYPIAGDWNGDGVDTVGIYRNGVFYLRNSNTTGFDDIVVAFGTSSDQPVVGDWDGDGIDTIGVYRNGTFILRNSNTGGPPELIFTLGNPGDVAIAGDWDGDGIVSCGVFRPTNGIVYLRNSNSTGFSDLAFAFGNAGDKPVAGDWNADGLDTIGIYRDGLFYLRNSNTTGFADIVFLLGNSGDFPIAGNWIGQP